MAMMREKARLKNSHMKKKNDFFLKEKKFIIRKELWKPTGVFNPYCALHLSISLCPIWEKIPHYNWNTVFLKLSSEGRSENRPARNVYSGTS